MDAKNEAMNRLPVQAIEVWRALSAAEVAGDMPLSQREMGARSLMAATVARNQLPWLEMFEIVRYRRNVPRGVKLLVLHPDFESVDG